MHRRERTAMIDINRHPSPRQLRHFGAIVLPILLTAGAIYLGLGRGLGQRASSLAPVLGAAAVLSLLLGLLCPGLLRPLFVGLQYAAFPLGWTLSHLVLLLIFALCVSPLGLLMRLCRRDRLGRRFDRQARSYWVERRPTVDRRRYFYQF
ncbi:MAG: SxtJ family membrane protein [Myxococcales bacterium]|nr:SxtJ family membrane protein [Myxococcota bacterium]MDW8282919.1 SxtJ family membrane protein [Myxococcales bacterium]